MDKKLALAALTAVAMAAATPTSSANAAGFLGKHVVKPLFGKKAQEKADKWNRDNGKPIENAGKVIITTIGKSIF